MPSSQAELFPATVTIGTLAMLPEKQPCYCRKADKHHHVNEHVFDGRRWIMTCSQAGIDLMAEISGAASSCRL